MNKLIYTNIFLNELESICEYISDDNPFAADNFAKEIFELTGKLSDFPLIGTLPKERYRQLKDYRKLVYGNYIIYYQFDSKNNKVFIHRLVHGARYKF